MELSLRLDTLGIAEMRYLRGRERYRDWAPFLLLAASRQARVFAYLSRDVVEQLHQQILAVEEATGLGADDEDDDEEENNGDEADEKDSARSTERENSPFSPALAQTLEKLNDLARQRLPDASGSVSQTSGELAAEPEGEEAAIGEEDALEQLQEAFVQMMEVVRELAEEISTDALKLTSRFRCARTGIVFTSTEPDEDEDEEDDDEDEGEGEGEPGSQEEAGDLEVELALVLQLFEEGRSRTDDLPAVELQLDVDDFEHLHETLDFALSRDSDRRRRSRR